MAEHGAWELASLSPAQLAADLERVDYDLVVADSIWLTEATFAPFLRLMRRGVRVAVMMHSFPSMIAAAESGGPRRTQPTSFEIETLERAGLVIAPGPHYLDLLRGASTDVQVFEPGLEDSWRSVPRPRAGACSLVSVGAVTPRKGFLDVVEALETRKRHDWRWTVVGSPDVSPAYARQVVESASKLGDVTFTGQRPHDEVRKIMTAADVLVMPSYDENQPLVLLEAMAASVPSVAYAAGAAERMVEHGAAGLVSPIGDRTTLAHNLARLIDDEEERYRMAEACWERQKTLPSWDFTAARARETFARLLHA
jgi:glycosyltransferase involved in cell wall biosynthesis